MQCGYRFLIHSYLLNFSVQNRVQNLLGGSRDRSDSSQLNPDSKMTTSTVLSSNGNRSASKGSDRMTASFTVAFGSSAPRSICTQASQAALRSQAAFEARLASYLNGRHSGCFLTQSSPYTSYARFVKPDLIPENHPIHTHDHSSSCHRRAVSANPAAPRHRPVVNGKGKQLTYIKLF